jgi:hypothetical protein
MIQRAYNTNNASGWHGLQNIRERWPLSPKQTEHLTQEKEEEEKGRLPYGIKFQSPSSSTVPTSA